jgi:hypothetical protein
MFTRLTLSDGSDVFTSSEMDAVVAGLAGQRVLSDTAYAVPRGFVMIEDEGRHYCINVSQVVLVTEVASRPTR